MDKHYHEAACLCGKVRLKIHKLSGQFIVCHCDTCKKWNGGPQFAMPCGTGVEVQGIEYLSEFPSSPWAKRGFCRNCGTHLYYKLNQSGNYNVLLGVLGLDKKVKLEMSMQYFIDYKPDCYSFDNNCPVMTEAEVLEKFSSSN
ncbi:GFA family protein [Photobacterium marinum]|uniref:GFA family protein n=1 Tax=Photobacterium marinum TaxID=1056511 RepID=UPI00056ABC5A|nr:GFA family protein [Photobacterium marinum]